MFLALAIVVALFGAVAHAYDCESGAVHVDKSGMGLTGFPDLTMCASTLETLYLSNNYLAEVPAFVGNFTVLRELRIDGNQIQSLPEELGQLINLRQLWASNNYLSNLPQSFSDLTQLEYVKLSYNQFNEVPPALLVLTNLQGLYMESNSISTLPPQLGNLYNIREAWFSSNPLHSVPAELGNWYSLHTFFLHGTQVSCLPKSMKRLYNFVEGNYLPACTNSTVSGYVVQRARKHGTCGGPVRNVTGFATGCINQVRIHCEEQDGTVVVTHHHLSDLDSRSLTCQADATITHTSVVTYPRCDEYSGVATTCADPDTSTEVPFPRKHPGMVTVGYADFETCHRKVSDGGFSRRLTATAETEAELRVSASDAGAKAATVMPLDRHRPRPDRAAFKTVTEAKLKSEREARQVEFRRGAVAARAGKQVASFICDVHSTYAYIDSNVTPSYDLSNCTSLRYLSIYGYDADVLAQQIPHLPLLDHLSLTSYVPMGLPANLHHLPFLTRLEVDTVFGPNLPDVLRNMTQLTSLRYTEKESQLFLPDWITELTNLRSLDLYGNRFYDLFPYVVTEMVNLRNLSMSSAQIYAIIPESITHLVNLQYLDLSYNYLNNVPAYLGRMTHLRDLNLASCGLSSLPESFGDLVNLNSLTLYGNYINCLPEKVRQLHMHNPAGLWNLHEYPVCPPIPLPLTFDHQRNAACLWDPYYEFWYRAACDTGADTVTVTLYADSACRKKAKRAAVHGLHQQFPGLGYCVPMNGTGVTFGTKYCHN